jgi:hypothetical protein
MRPSSLRLPPAEGTIPTKRGPLAREAEVDGAVHLGFADHAKHGLHAEPRALRKADSAHSSTDPASSLLRPTEGAVEVEDDVGRVLEPDREADHVLADPCGCERFGADLQVRGRGRVNHQVLASPTFARCEASAQLSMNRRPAARPPLTPKVTIDPAPFGKSFLASR